MKLKSYVYFVERPDGCLVRGADRSFVVQGEGAYAKVARLLGYCDGRYSHDQLRSAIAIDAQPWFDTLVAELESNRFLLPVEPGPASVEDVSRYDDTIAYLSDWHDTPRAAFAAWRAARVALVGGGEVAAITARSLSELGVGAVVDHPDDATLTIVLCDSLGAGEVAKALSAASVAPEQPVLAAGGMSGGALVLPVLSGAASVLAALDRVRLPDLEIGATSETALTIAAGLVAIEALHFVVGPPGPSAVPTHRLFHVSAHGFVEPHIIPAAYFGDTSLPDPTAWAVDNDPAHDLVSGLFVIDHAEADRQMPLHLFGLRVRPPKSAGGIERAVLGWGLTEREAAYRAHLAAVTAYTAASASDGVHFAVCRDASRTAAAQTAWESPVGTMTPLARIATVGGQTAMFDRLLQIYGLGDILAATADAGTWVVAEVEHDGTRYRCVGEHADAALGEILGALVAACQSGTNIAKIIVPPIAAQLPDDAVRAERAVARKGVDPVLGRLGWHVAELAR